MTCIDLCFRNITLAVFYKKGILQNLTNQKSKIISFLFFHFAEKSFSLLLRLLITQSASEGKRELHKVKVKQWCKNLEKFK